MGQSLNQVRKGVGGRNREKGQPREGWRKPKGNADVWHALLRDHRRCWCTLPTDDCAAARLPDPSVRHPPRLHAHLGLFPAPVTVMLPSPSATGI